MRAYYTFIEDDYFVYATYNDVENSYIYLYGLTQEGKKQKYLILPQTNPDGEEIDVFGIGYGVFMGGT